MRLLRKPRSPIGLDIGSRTLKAAQWTGPRDAPRILALSLLPRIKPGEPVDRAEVLNLKSVLRRQGFQGTEMVVAVPEGQLLRGTFELPPGISGAPAAQVARMELSRIHHLDPGSFEVVHWGLPCKGPSKANTQTVAVACPHQAAHMLLDTFGGCGLDVVALDVRTAAAARACKRLLAPAPAITAILDLGWSDAKLLLILGGTVIYERLLQTRLAKIPASLSEESHIDIAMAYQLVETLGLEAGSPEGGLDEVSLQAIHRLIRKQFHSLIEELKAPFSYASHQYSTDGVKRILLVGGVAAVKGLAQYFESAVAINTVSVVPSAVAAGDSGVLAKTDHPAVTVALGLALFSEDKP